jgi:hypothetical protein
MNYTWMVLSIKLGEVHFPKQVVQAGLHDRQLSFWEVNVPEGQLSTQLLK